jgi:hypothetical protein
VTAPAIAEVDFVHFAGSWSMPVPKAAESFVAAVLSLTKAATAGDVLEVRRLPRN